MRAIVRIVLLLFLGACASSAGPDVTMRLEQLSTYADLNFGGPVNVEFRVTVRNDTDADVILRRIEVRTVGGGAYSLNEPPITLDMEIGAKSAEQTAITVRGFAVGGNMNSREPASVRATGYFEGPKGAFTRTVNEAFGRE